MKHKIYKKCLLAIVTYNNGRDLKKVLQKKKKLFPVDILVYFDGSNDNSEKYIPKNWLKKNYVIINKNRSGISNSIKKIVKFALKKKYEFICLMPGNDKNNINDSIFFYEKLINENLDYVQGSRFLKGGGFKNTPLSRIFLIRLFSWFFSFCFNKKCSDCSEGMRSYRLNILKNKNINIFQKWLENYELESYLHFKVFKLNLKYGEVPVKKTYKKNKYHFLFNPKGKKYTYIRPFVDWWNILKPYIYLSLKLKN